MFLCMIIMVNYAPNRSTFKITRKSYTLLSIDPYRMLLHAIFDTREAQEDKEFMSLIVHSEEKLIKELLMLIEKTPKT